MILDRYPDQPGQVTGLKYIGYWHSVKIDTFSGLPLTSGYDFDRYQRHFGYSDAYGLRGPFLGR